MTLGEHCDEIIRLIDEALGTQALPRTPAATLVRERLPLGRHLTTDGARSTPGTTGNGQIISLRARGVT
jgi:hypothetical protein